MEIEKTNEDEILNVASRFFNGPDSTYFEGSLLICEIARCDNFDYNGLSIMDVVTDWETMEEGGYEDWDAEGLFPNTYVTFADGTTKTISDLSAYDVAGILLELAQKWDA